MTQKRFVQVDAETGELIEEGSSHTSRQDVKTDSARGGLQWHTMQRQC